jgi:hypothetical protein
MLKHVYSKFNEMGKMSAIWMKAVIQSIKASSYTRITPNWRKNNPLTHQVWNEVHVALRTAASGLAREAFVLEKVEKPSQNVLRI